MTEQKIQFTKPSRKHKSSFFITYHRRYIAAAFLFLIIISIGSIRKKKHKSLPSLRRLEFVHITKTGGSAIESVAAKHGVRWGVCHFMDNDMVGCEPSSKPHAPWRELYIGTAWHAPPKVINALVPTQDNPYHDADLFVVVRNPYDRAVSEYYCNFFGMKAADESPEIMNLWIQEMVQNLNDHPARYYYKSPTMPKYPSKKHFLNQVEYIYNLDGTKLVTNVLYYEKLSYEFNSLMERYNMPMRLSSNKKKHGINVSQSRGRTKKLTFRDLNEKTIRMVNEYAAKDFEKLGYNMVNSFEKDYKLEADADKRIH